MNVPLWGWLTVFGVILLLLAADLLGNRKAPDPSFTRSVVVSLMWIGVSVLFGIVLGIIYGSVTARDIADAAIAPAMTASQEMAAAVPVLEICSVSLNGTNTIRTSSL